MNESDGAWLRERFRTDSARQVDVDGAWNAVSRRLDAAESRASSRRGLRVAQIAAVVAVCSIVGAGAAIRSAGPEDVRPGAGGSPEAASTTPSAPSAPSATVPANVSTPGPSTARPAASPTPMTPAHVALLRVFDEVPGEGKVIWQNQTNSNDCADVCPAADRYFKPTRPPRDVYFGMKTRLEAAGWETGLNNCDCVNVYPGSGEKAYSGQWCSRDGGMEASVVVETTGAKRLLYSVHVNAPGLPGLSVCSG